MNKRKIWQIPFLRKEGIKAIEAQGTFITTEDGEFDNDTFEYLF